MLPTLWRPEGSSQSLLSQHKASTSKLGTVLPDPRLRCYCCHSTTHDADAADCPSLTQKSRPDGGLLSDVTVCVSPSGFGGLSQDTRPAADGSEDPEGAGGLSEGTYARGQHTWWACADVLGAFQRAIVARLWLHLVRNGPVEAMPHVAVRARSTQPPERWLPVIHAQRASATSGMCAPIVDLSVKRALRACPHRRLASHPQWGGDA